MAGEDRRLNWVEKMLLEYTGNTRCGTSLLGILHDQGLIPLKDIDLMSKREAKSISQMLCEILETKPDGNDYLEKLLKSYGLVLCLTTPENMDEADEKYDPKIDIWEFIAKRVIKRIEDSKMLGCLKLHYNCTYTNKNHQFIYEVVQINEDSFWRFTGSFMEIFQNTFRQRNVIEKDNMWQHRLNVTLEDCVLLVGLDLNSLLECEDISTSRIVCLIGTKSFLEWSPTALRVSLYSETLVVWGALTDEARRRILDQGKVSFQSMEISASDLYIYLDGDELDQMIRDLSLEIHPRDSFYGCSDFPDEPWRRWLRIGGFRVDDTHKDCVFIVCNASRCELRNISSRLNVPAYYEHDLLSVHEIEPSHVLVTQDVDYNAAQKLLEDIPKAVKKILLHFEGGELSRVISEEEILQEKFKRMVFIGPIKDGKTSMLLRISKTCPAPVFKFTASDLLNLFETIQKDESITSILAKSLGKSYFEKKLIERVLETLNVIVMIDDNLWKETKEFPMQECRLDHIIDSFLEIPQFRIVLVTNLSSTASLHEFLETKYPKLSKLLPNTKHPQVIASLLPISAQEKVNLVLRECGTQSTHAIMYANIICNDYLVKFRGMPAMIWSTVGRLYADIVATHSRMKAETIPTRIVAANVYDEFFKSVSSELKYQPSVEVPYQDEMANFFFAVNESSPKQSHVNICRQLHWDSSSLNNIVHNMEYTKYFLDLFYLQVITGRMEIDDSMNKCKFEDFFYNRYIRESKTSEFNLNDMLGYTKLDTPYPFSIDKYNIMEVVLLSGHSPNCTRILFEAFLSSTNRRKFSEWCTSEQESDISVTDLFGFFSLEKTSFTIRQVLLLCSVKFGYHKLFCFLAENNSDLLEWENIRIRGRNSFKTLLHLLTYHSRDNDQTTITEKMQIIDDMTNLKAGVYEIRDYYGNSSHLEEQIHFRLFEKLINFQSDHFSSITNTDYIGCNVLDKNPGNTELIYWLKETFPEAYKCLLVNFRVWSLPKTCETNSLRIKKFKYEEQEDPFVMTEDDREMDVDTTENTFEQNIISDYFSEPETRASSVDVAVLVKKRVRSGPITDKFLTMLLTKIFEIEEYSFKHKHLCSILNGYLADVITQPSLFSPRQQKLTREKTFAAFIAATLARFNNIAKFFFKNFNSDLPAKLDDYELRYVTLALETIETDICPIDLLKTLEETGYQIPWHQVAKSLVLCSSKLFQQYRRREKITKDMLKEALTYVLRETMFENETVIERKKLLLKCILEAPELVETPLDLFELWELKLDLVHYQLIRYLFEKTSVNLTKSDKYGKTVLNYCLENIIHYEEYLGESVYNENFYHHDQVVYLAKKVGVNSLANEQLKSILPGITRFVKAKTSALQAAGFCIGESVPGTALGNPVLIESSIASMSILPKSSTTMADANSGLVQHPVLSWLINKYRTSLIDATNVSSSLLRSSPFIKYFDFKTLHELDDAEVSSSQRALYFWKEVMLQERIKVEELILAFRQQSQQGVVHILEEIMEEMMKEKDYHNTAPEDSAGNKPETLSST